MQVTAHTVLAGPLPEALEVMARALSIAPDHLLAYGADSDFAILRSGGNCGLFAPVDGDFAFSCDVTLPGVTEAQLLDALLWASQNGRRMALPAEQAGPDTWLLFEDGQRLLAQIRQDELLDEVRITDRRPIPA